MYKAKEQIRKKILSQLSSQSKKKALKKSKAVKKKLFSCNEFKKANFVMLYASKDEEVSTCEIIDEALRMGKRVALPLCTSQKTITAKQISDRKRDLERGTYGIWQPRKCQKDANLKEIDLVVVPAVAFDKKNVRLGRGKGYYDKFLSKSARNKYSIGLAFDFQVVDSLPKDSHDIPVSKVITA